jgi:prevent-host-death family protein
MKTIVKKSKIIGVKELRENLETYIGAVAKGHTFTVVRRSKPVFQIAPVAVDEWGDEGTWETVVDFSKEKGGGIPMKEFADLLRTSLKNGQKSKAHR